MNILPLIIMNKQMKDDESLPTHPLHGEALIFVEAAKLRQKLGRPLTGPELIELRSNIASKGYDKDLEGDDYRSTIFIWLTIITLFIFIILYIGVYL